MNTLRKIRSIPRFLGSGRRAHWRFVALAALAVAALGASAAFAFTVNGSITGSDPTQTDRLFRNGLVSTCAVPKGNPGTTSAGLHHYDAYRYTNTTASPQCVTVSLTTSCQGVNFLFDAAYTSFVPASPSTNWLADPGNSPLGMPGVTTFSFNAPANSPFDVVVSEVSVNAGCSSYTLDVTGNGIIEGEAAITLTFVIEELTPGGPIPYVPGTWVKNPVRATWTCTTTFGSSLIHWTPAGNGPFFTATFVKTWTQNGSHTEQPRGLSLSDDCRDRAGNVAVVDPSVPTVAFKVNIDNVAPVCNLSPLVKTVAVGGPTTITWSFNPSDAVSGVATTELVSATDVGGATHADWTLGGPIADKTGTVTFTGAPQSVVFVYLVTDVAGNTKTCTSTAKTP